MLSNLSLTITGIKKKSRKIQHAAFHSSSEVAYVL